MVNQGRINDWPYLPITVILILLFTTITQLPMMALVGSLSIILNFAWLIGLAMGAWLKWRHTHRIFNLGFGLCVSLLLVVLAIGKIHIAGLVFLPSYAGLYLAWYAEDPEFKKYQKRMRFLSVLALVIQLGLIFYVGTVLA